MTMLYFFLGFLSAVCLFLGLAMYGRHIIRNEGTNSIERMGESQYAVLKNQNTGKKHVVT